jgi:very-short-patch-repair endonuclease
VLTRQQLLELGFSRREIERRIESGRLHRVRSGIYAVGRPSLTEYGRWMAAVLACGDGAVLSHSSAAALWRIGREQRGLVEVSLPNSSRRRHPGIRIHRRPSLNLQRDLTREYGIPVTTPGQTLIDMSVRLDRPDVERMINEADKYNLTHPPQLREALDARTLQNYYKLCRPKGDAAGRRAGEKGAARLRFILDRRTFRLTKEELERRFLPLTREAGLPTPLTGQFVNDFEVDFYWPDLGVVIETDGLRYHRTPAEQARDRLRDQTHTAAGLTPLRFTHEQVRCEPEHVLVVLKATTRMLVARSAQLVADAPSPLNRAAIWTK